MNDRDNPQEHRHFLRIPFDAQLRVIGDTDAWPAELIDISLNGALFAHPKDWRGSVGDPFILEITLSPDAVITMDVRVAHMEDRHVGVHCEHIDVDSISHLRRLVELNVGDPELLHRELTALGTLGRPD